MKSSNWRRVNKHCPRFRMLQKVLAAVLTAMFAAQAAGAGCPQDPEFSLPNGGTPAASDAAKAEMLNLPEGAFVEVRLEGNVKLRGQVGDLAETDFALRTIKNDRMTELRVPYTELQSVRILGKPQTRGRSFDTTVRRARLVMGLVAGAILVGVTIYAAANAR